MKTTKMFIVILAALTLALSPVVYAASDTEQTVDLRTYDDSKPVKINSRNYTQTSGNSIGFQVKPSQTVTTTGEVIGGEISPRLQNGINAAVIKGLHVNVDLKGTSTRTISGDVRGLEVELTTSNSGTSTIDGYVTGLRFRSAFSATTLTGEFSAIRFEFPEAQTNSQTYDEVFQFTGTIPLVWNNTPGTEPSTADGYLKVEVNGTDRWIQLYSSAPVD